EGAVRDAGRPLVQLDCAAKIYEATGGHVVVERAVTDCGRAPLTIERAALGPRPRTSEGQADGLIVRESRAAEAQGGGDCKDSAARGKRPDGGIRAVRLHLVAGERATADRQRGVEHTEDRTGDRDGSQAVDGLIVRERAVADGQGTAEFIADR